MPEILDELWYVLLIDRRQTGEHWVVAPPAGGKARKTRNLDRAVAFATEAQARHFAERMPRHRGYNVLVGQCLRYRKRRSRRPGKRRVLTEYGTVTALEDQLLLLEKAQEEMTRTSRA